MVNRKEGVTLGFFQPDIFAVFPADHGGTVFRHAWNPRKKRGAAHRFAGVLCLGRAGVDSGADRADSAGMGLLNRDCPNGETVASETGACFGGAGADGRADVCEVRGLSACSGT